MGKLSALAQETTAALSDFIVKVKSSGGGDVLVTLQNFINFLGKNGSNPYKFSAFYSGGAGTNMSVAGTLIKCDTVEFDTGSNYSASTGRFTAPVDGYYVINAGIGANNSAAAGYMDIILKKNGTTVAGTGVGVSTARSVSTLNLSKLIHMVAGDYIELYGAASTTWSVTSGVGNTSFTGFLVSIT